MKLEDIYEFFRNPPPHYLNRELAVCYVLFVLLQSDSYGTELIQLLESTHPNCRLSDTVLYGAFRFLEEERIVKGYWRKSEGRGRPRRMYQLVADYRPLAQELAQLWNDYPK
jgi:DNA-binding PadR family transcriptional regulator